MRSGSVARVKHEPRLLGTLDLLPFELELDPDHSSESCLSSSVFLALGMLRQKRTYLVTFNVQPVEGT
jgi:hypothetical protein